MERGRAFTKIQDLKKKNLHGFIQMIIQPTSLHTIAM